MVLRRDRMEIASDILDICQGGANKTRIVYQANLNFKTVNAYIDLLTAKGLLVVDLSAPSKLYRTTEKGSSLLEDIKWVRDILRD
ncbi:MAG: winged helix-turn-helix domain-containing protein [Methanotrichaceae archaeon]|nr:winged helix-turn-helix domain-containing protein [Methanotrichaceae archaeon]